MSTVSEHPIGSRPILTCSFYDETETARPLADPSEVTCRVYAPGSPRVVTVYVYNGGAGAVTKASTGKYELAVDLDAAGDWLARWEGSGAIVAATPDYTVRCKGSAIPLA